MRPILLDTHTAIWSADGSLSKSILNKIDDAGQRSQLMLSPISAWEIGMLVEKGRLRLASSAQDYIRRLFTLSGVVTATLTPSIALTAAVLPKTFHGDPADRIIVASAISYGADLFTRDGEILRFAKAVGALKAFRV